MEEYFPSLSKTLGGNKPAVTRVVPVNKSIEAEPQVLRYEDLRRSIEGAKSFALRDCICRKEKALEGHACEHPLETCLGFSSEENAFDYFNYSGRVITKEEALRLLDETEKEGLVHCTYNVQNEQMFVCNCCSCCCGLIRAMTVLEAPYVLVRSNFVAAINQETCSACGTCAEKRCPVEAIFSDNGAYAVKPERCIGCGVCTVTCPTESITIARRPESEQDTPPKDVMKWSIDRLYNRAGPLKKLAMKAYLAFKG